jgi:hypothetical protein
MGLLQIDEQQFYDLDGSVGGMLTVNDAPSFYIAIVATETPGVVTLKGVQSNDNSNEYILNIISINGGQYLSYANNNQFDTYTVSICSGFADEQPTPWTCVPGVAVPIRMNSNGGIECLSQDGQNCIWPPDGNCADVDQSISGVDPLTCGDEHWEYYGITGYDSSTHWCFIGWDYFKPWLCIPGQTSPMRVNAMGNVECLSTDGINCQWNTVSCETIQDYDASSISPINPLVCGADHLSVWGSTGYDDPPNHWCFVVLDDLEPMCVDGETVEFCNDGPGCTGTYNCPLNGS